MLLLLLLLHDVLCSDCHRDGDEIVHKGWWSDEMSRALEYMKTLKHLKVDAYMQADSCLHMQLFSPIFIR